MLPMKEVALITNSLTNQRYAEYVMLRYINRSFVITKSK